MPDRRAEAGEAGAATWPAEGKRGTRVVRNGSRIAPRFSAALWTPRAAGLSAGRVIAQGARALGGLAALAHALPGCPRRTRAAFHASRRAAAKFEAARFGRMVALRDDAPAGLPCRCRSSTSHNVSQRTAVFPAGHPRPRPRESRREGPGPLRSELFLKTPGLGFFAWTSSPMNSSCFCMVRLLCAGFIIGDAASAVIPQSMRQGPVLPGNPRLRHSFKHTAFPFRNRCAHGKGSHKV